MAGAFYRILLIAWRGRCCRNRWCESVFGLGRAVPGVLLSIAVMPLVVPNVWHHHFGKITAGWALAFLIPFAAYFGIHAAWVNLVHALLAEYVPFVILLTALYVVAGGIYIGAACKVRRG